MITIILCSGKYVPVTDHRNAIPLKEYGTVDYDEYVNRIELVYEERIKDKIKHNLCEVFS